MRCRQALMMRIELFWRCLVCALLAGTAHTATLCPSETNLKYVGRWDVSTATKPWAQAQGATLIARFTGTSVAATLDLSGGEVSRVIIDGAAATSAKVSFESGVSRPLAVGLEAGTHTLELVDAVAVESSPGCETPSASGRFPR